MRKMKDSGFAWLGLIPVDWKVERLGSLFSLRNEKVSDEDFPPLSVTMQGVLPQLSHVAKSDNHSNRKLVLEGDFVINSRSDRRNSCGFALQDGSVSLVNTVCTPLNPVDSRYYAYLFDTSLWADEFYAWGHGIVADLWTTGWNAMKDIVLPVPDLNSQVSIADYLDVRCSDIDIAIHSAQCSIDEYQIYEMEQIRHYVSNGLNDTRVKGTDSHNFESIPEEWDFLPVKVGIRIGHGSDPVQNGTVPVFGSGSKPFKTCGESKNGPAVLLGRKGTLNRPVFVDGRYWNVDTAFDATVRKNNLMILRFFYYVSKCINVDVLSTSTAKPSMTQSAWYGVKIPYPPIEEQMKICRYLDTFCANVDALIEAKQSIIEDLKAYKQSLIYEVVTGKREV